MATSVLVDGYPVVICQVKQKERIWCKVPLSPEVRMPISSLIFHHYKKYPAPIMPIIHDISGHSCITWYTEEHSLSQIRHCHVPFQYKSVLCWSLCSYYCHLLPSLYSEFCLCSAFVPIWEIIWCYAPGLAYHVSMQCGCVSNVHHNQPFTILR